MTKALVTIEVDIDTPVHRDSGAGESSNPSHPGRRFLEDEKRNYIWDEVHKWVENKNEFSKIVKVQLVKEGK
jgi:hypothetical protein